MVELGKHDELIFEQFKLDPTDNARAHRVAEMMKAGKVTLGGGGGGGGSESGDALSMLVRANERYAQATASLKQSQREREKAVEERCAAEKSLAEARALKSRNVFRHDDRQLEWRYIVSLALKTDLIRHDDEGAKIAWRYRRLAIEVFTSHLWQWREVTPALLRGITLRWSAAGGFAADIEDLLVPLELRSTRAGPTQQDWTAVRDRLQA